MKGDDLAIVILQDVTNVKSSDFFLNPTSNAIANSTQKTHEAKEKK